MVDTNWFYTWNYITIKLTKITFSIHFIRGGFIMFCIYSDQKQEEENQVTEKTPLSKENTYTTNADDIRQSTTVVKSNDKGGLLWVLLGCCIPIVGLILFLIWRNDRPQTAKSIGIGTLVGIAIALLFFSFIFGLSYAFSTMI